MSERITSLYNCKKCKSPLWTETEEDFNTCNRCLDAQAERNRERQEFEHYHPSGE